MEWIKIKDKLPPQHELIYLGSSKKQWTTLGKYIEGTFIDPDYEYEELNDVTHWMPLPEPPNE